MAETEHYNPYEFNEVEVPGHSATREQLSALYTRYAFAEKFCRDKKVLEMACGPGIGLTYLANRAQSVTGGDLDARVLKIARNNSHHQPNIELLQFDAENPPFADESFDTILLFEAIYYLKSSRRFFSGAERLLRIGGTLIVSTVNPDGPGFHPTRFATGYLNSRELCKSLNGVGLQPQIYGAFRVEPNILSERLRVQLKKNASLLRIIPESVKSKERLKRLFCGPLKPIPKSINDAMGKNEIPVLLKSHEEGNSFKLLFALGKKA